MKSHTKLILAGSIMGLAAYQKYLALAENRSLRSRVTEKSLPLVDFIPVIKSPQDYQNALKKSETPYDMPFTAEKIDLFHHFEGQRDVLAYNPPVNSHQGKYIFYVHGGAYWGQPFPQHFDMLKKIADKSGARVIMPIYPKAPAHHADDVLSMILDTYNHFLNDDGIDPKKMIFIGDSAGGGFALEFMQYLRDNQLPLPQQAVLISPWIDISNSNPDMKAIDPYDPILGLKNLTYLGKEYAGDLDVHDPLVSPLYGDSSNLPPISVFTGTHDILNPDAKRFHRNAKKRGWDVTIYNYDKMNHVFPLLPIPEAQDAVEKIVNIIGRQ
ncbi:putative acetyl-hydrolase LipR precursor [Lentilactobacillus sunkii]|jgi:acetyl esterase/lipase|uniref:Putative acetyl-hydrolase LipR n=1 Tax=Lentilactobacillus sunkii TaxID=481719 RepID=A0A1E7XGN9_9LACO|nr:alpha/beta hydrolase [Lentilactobacillus sunkii]OFA12247.1 putative acetyl-hydrolase LipR precursor [Lentilactobacillus sunkii]